MDKQGTVIKSVGGVFTVSDVNGETRVCYSPKKLRYKSDDVIIGDKVLYEPLKNGKGVISQTLPRKNKLARPEIANVDVCFIVVAVEPQADLYLVDKVLINCFQEGIEPVIVVNKSDLTEETYNQVKANYQTVADVISTSSTDGSVEQIRAYLKGKTACFAGQSAVGKTSLINALLQTSAGAVGGLSAKTGRGMHTTRHAALLRTDGGFIADTCGFSLCDLHGIRSDELRLYLDDFVRLSGGCKYPSCTHTVEPDCAVKRAALTGALNSDRYSRYLEEYAELVEFEKNRY